MIKESICKLKSWHYEMLKDKNGEKGGGGYQRQFLADFW